MCEMRILLLGSYYSSNLGDGAICECVAARLKRHFPAADIAIGDLLGRQRFCTDETFEIEQLKTLSRKTQLRKLAYFALRWDKQLQHEEWRLNAAAKKLDELCSAPTDLAVFAGGQMFMDAYALFLEHCVRCFSVRKVPVLFNACGVGPAYSESIRKRLESALQDPVVRLVSTRDDARLIEERYSPAQQTKVTFDPALWCAEVYGVERKKGADTIGLGVMFTRSLPVSKLTGFWTQMIRTLERRGVKWKIFVNGDPGDVCLARNILSRIPELVGREEQCLAPVPATPRELVEVISGFSGLISFRLHSHIIAASLGIPTAAVVWDEKLNFFFEKIGCPERCCSMRESPEKILQTLERAAQTGYHTQLITEQKQYADTLLRDAVRQEMKRMSL